MELSEADLIRLMPELKGQTLEIMDLKGGITNRLFRVKSSGGGDYVFRFYGQKTELFIDRHEEMENLRRLGVLGITPGLVLYLPEQGVTVVEFIPGSVLKNGDFLKEELWEKIIDPIRRIHQSGIAIPRLFDPLCEVKRLQGILEQMNASCRSFDIPGTIRILEAIDALAAVPHSRYVPCHNDLLADNFVLTGRTGSPGAPMVLIDWEYGGMAPAHYDLADMFQEILVPRAVETKLLDLYGEGRDGERHRYLTDLFKPFPDIYWFLWSLIQANISTIDFDYVRYGEEKYDHARQNIAFLRSHYGVNI